MTVYPDLANADTGDLGTMDQTFDDATSTRQGAQGTFFRITDNIPEEAWYWAAIGSIGLSAVFRLTGHAHWSLFVGQWPPTLILFALYHRLIRPSAKR